MQANDTEGQEVLVMKRQLTQLRYLQGNQPFTCSRERGEIRCSSVRETRCEKRLLQIWQTSRDTCARPSASQGTLFSIADLGLRSITAPEGMRVIGRTIVTRSCPTFSQTVCRSGRDGSIVYAIWALFVKTQGKQFGL